MIKRLIILSAAFLCIITAVCFYITRESYSVPVLMYHYIGDEDNGKEICVSKQDFKKQINYLKDNNYKFLSLDELYDYEINNKKFPRKAVVITFDDGYDNVYTNAFPVIKEFDAKGTVFVITSKIGDKHYLNKQQIKDLQQSGYIKIGSHSVNHKNMRELSFDEQLKELKDSKEELEKIIEDKINYAAYPYGSFNGDTIKASKKAGYKLAFQVYSGYTRTGDNIYKLKRLSALSDYNYFTKIVRVTRTSDLKFLLKKVANQNNKES